MAQCRARPNGGPVAKSLLAAATISGISEGPPPVGEAPEAERWKANDRSKADGPQGPAPADTQVTTGDIDSQDRPLTTLRGAGVDVDVRRVGQVVIGICLVGVAVLAVIQLVAGFQKNAQINSLRNNGVPFK